MLFSSASWSSSAWAWIFTLQAELGYKPSDSLCSSKMTAALLFYSLPHAGGFCFNHIFWTAESISPNLFFVASNKNVDPQWQIKGTQPRLWTCHVVIGSQPFLGGRGSCASLEWLAEWSVCPAKQIHKPRLMFRSNQRHSSGHLMSTADPPGCQSNNTRSLIFFTWC